MFDPPKGYRTDFALIVAPYFDLRFIERLVSTLRPKQVRMLVDGGADIGEVALALKGFGKRDAKMAFARCRGIAHIKLYYLEYELRGGERRRRHRRLILGSANATEAAFGDGGHNAEVLAVAPLHMQNDASVLQYLHDVRKAIEGGGGEVECKVLEPQHAFSLWLPALSVAAVERLPDFDDWVQRGRLVARYQDPQQFLRVRVGFTKPAPRGDFAQALDIPQVSLLGDTTGFSYGYANAGGTLSATNGEPNWKAKFTTWTQFGFWMSGECFRANRGMLHLSKSMQRREALNAFVGNFSNERWKAGTTDKFIDTLETVWRNLSERYKPSDYLRSANGRLDEATFRKSIREKFSADYTLAKEPEFQERYISGFDTPRVPKFRNDASAWEEFVLSFCNTLVIAMEGRKVQSQLASRLKMLLAALGVARADTTADRLLEILRQGWDEPVQIGRLKTRVGEWLQNYHA